jgi:FdrA protein
MKIAELLENGPRVINVGLRNFARDLDEQQVDVVQLDWRPPAPEDEEMKRMLEKLL